MILDVSKEDGEMKVALKPNLNKVSQAVYTWCRTA